MKQAKNYMEQQLDKIFEDEFEAPELSWFETYRSYLMVGLGVAGLSFFAYKIWKSDI